MDILYFQGVRPFRLGGTIMDILYFQGVRPFKFGGELSWTSFTSKGYDPLGWGRKNYHGHPLLSKGYDPLGWGELSWTSFTSRGYDPLGWGGTIMDILYFQVRPFRLEEVTIMDILYFPRGTTL